MDNGGAMPTSRILVAGATGQLGRAIAGKLLERGTGVRALARTSEKLAPLAAAGAEIAAVDLLDVPKLNEACRGVDQIVATANNNMGKGTLSPARVDVAAYQNLCAAARNAKVRRIVYVSYRGLSQDAPVDIFRIKWYIEDVIRRSGLPFVMLRPTAFMDVWVDQILAAGIRKSGTSTIFGDGTRVANYIAVEDVAEFAVRILEREDVVNEVVEVGGPSDLSQNDLASLVEQQLQATGRRRHIPVVAMKYLPPIVRPFNEVAARMMTLGLYSATEASPFPGYRQAADRFGVSPRTVESYVRAM